MRCVFSWLKRLLERLPHPKVDLTDPEEFDRENERLRVLSATVAWYKLDPKERVERRKHPR